MWSHYADCHKGFCIEYDFSALEKIQNEPGPQDAREINIDFKLSAESGSPEISGFRPESGPHRKTQVLN